MKKILVAMSGGVDSSVVAHLLLQQGYEVAGITMKLWCDDVYGNCTDNIIDAKRVCEHLGIAHYIVDFSTIFFDKVISPFVENYLDAKTPNPCIFCNQNLKFGALLEKTLQLGYDFLATGHYAQILNNNNNFELCKANCIEKDQSYVLYMLNQQQLSHIIFPLGELNKSQARFIAKQAGLPVYSKPDSQDICFVQDGDYVSLVARHSDKVISTGDIVLENGTVIGKHNGIINYTIGQRKGIGHHNQKMYVTRIDAESNQVVIGTSLLRNQVFANNCYFSQPVTDGMKLEAKIRYACFPSAGILYIQDTIKFVFEQAQRAITPGQSIVFYNDNVVVGGGIIQ